MFKEKEEAINKIFGEPSSGPPWRRCRLYSGNDMEMLHELANEESSLSGSLSSISDPSEED
jgi:hypothetical protein